MGEKHDSSGSPRAARTANDARSQYGRDNPQVKPRHCRPAGHDPNALAGREMMERTGLVTGLVAIGEAAGSAASIVLGQAEPARTSSRAILLATLGR
jgi:hypothetical protein